MRPLRDSLILAFLAAGLVIGSPRCVAESELLSSDAPLVVRVFYIQHMDAREASRLVRTHIPIKAMVQVDGKNLLGVIDVLDKVEQCGELLRQQDVLLRATDPHKPLEYARLAQSPTATRVFQVPSKYLPDAMVTLGALYDLRNGRDVTILADGKSISVRAAQPLLDASEALLRELSFLVESTKRSGGS
jgi:hypothetical protein